MYKIDENILSFGSEKLIDFLNKPFNVNQLYPEFIEKSEETLFDGWVGKNFTNWHKFTYDNHILEIYSDTYKIKHKKNNKIFELPYPDTIKEFINDCHKFKIDLYWSNYFDIHFKPNEYLNDDQTISYYKELLNKMDKSNELLM